MDALMKKPIIVRKTSLGNCFVDIEYEGKVIEAMDWHVNDDSQNRLRPGDEVEIVSYISNWPKVRKVAKIFNIQEHPPSVIPISFTA